MERNKNDKKKHTGRNIFLVILTITIMLGVFLGYSIAKNGGGLQGLLATILGQDIEKLENLDTINILVLRSK